jgi:hypothetical protein
MKACNTTILPEYRVKFLDGNCIESTEYRLKVLRDTKAGALPGKLLIIFDIVEEKDWGIFVNGSISEVSAALLFLAGTLNLRKFKKNKRVPKKSPTPKDKFKGKPHVSTAKLLAAEG